VVQFIFHSNNGCSEHSGPKRCSRKKLECDFWTRGQNPKVQNAPQKFCNTYYKMKNQSIRSRQLQLFHFQLSFLKHVLFKPKNAYILKIRVQIKKVFCAKKLLKVFWNSYRWSKNFLIFSEFWFFLEHPLQFYCCFTLKPRIYLLFGLQVKLSQKQPLRSIF